MEFLIIAKIAFWLFVLYCLIAWAWKSSKYDSTDEKEGGRRSGMQLYIDHGTGLHYLSAPFGIGGLIPRLNRSGNHVSEDDLS